ncbi:S-type pyocin domain-containing protein [Pseudomonas sp. B21-048]|uniref:S-type pyocin domain-containing protein n=1 Tax=Pseudomonas sp. B21-048 TaxID=2895490 RepID=UPI00215DE197|nr:S-type pyocin domain-containing protein [Pseudomonas sp. B21-048]UVK97378.1 S-type pyocin domain-containing protein [Pseudomonas sp. B21-048]
MQNSIASPPPLTSSNAPPNPPMEYPRFLSNFDSALNWDGALPTVTVAHRIETIDKEPDAYSKLVAIAHSAQDQIRGVFSNGTAGVRNEIEGRISSATDAHPFNKLEGALKKKIIIVELLQRVRLNRSWYEADAFFGIDALSLDSMESAELFAAYVDSAEHDAERLGLYESFLRSLTAAYVKRILVEAVSILDDASPAIDAAIHSALARGETAYSFNLTLSQSAQVVTVAGAATLQNADGWTFEAAIRKSVLLLTGLGDVVLSRATAIGIGALLYSPSLGNGERYPQTALKLSGSAVLPDAPSNLNEIAAVEGTIDLPYRIYGDLGQYTLVATPAGGGISSAVPVRALEFDQKTNSYSFTSTDTPPITLSFPIIHWDNSSTTSPARPVEVPRYSGVELLPLLVQPETLPAFELPDFRDCIYCFPINSGLPPIYVVFNSPYEGATTRGKYSGRLFNPAQAGGPILDLDWTNTSVTKAGIDLVKLHTGRFEPSDANAIMVDRLERIFEGKLVVTAIDKRFYTHELRELERFRTLGVIDGVRPNDEGATWNNTHAATLEDYKLKDASELLYTPDALEADEKQRERMYKQLGGVK